MPVKGTSYLKKDYAHGAIVRMKLENFVTYDSLEFSPGANLNVIIGPNGTGKSSIVCAICLGMAGKPLVLGRAGTVSDYIKYGRSKATIEIELNNENGKNFTITRYLYKDNRSEWLLNERAVRLKEIEELIAGLDIQVGNLCQFLPQEKVAEFARLNTYELLESTERAVGGIDLIDKHNQLKENSKTSRNLDRDVSQIEEQLHKEEQTNARLESKVSSYLEKKKFEDSVLWLRRKRACLIYSKKRKEYDAIKEERKIVNNNLLELNEKFKPIEEKYSKIDVQIQNLKTVLNNKTKQIKEFTSSSLNLSNKLNIIVEKINEVKSDYKTKENDIQAGQANLKKLCDDVAAIKSQYDEAKLNMDDITNSEKAIHKRDVNARAEFEKLSTKQYEATNEITKLKNEQDSLLKRLTNLKSVREEKLTKLKNGHNHSYKAIEWLDLNKEKFHGQVYEPMFLLINVKTPRLAKYIEASIPNRDLCSLFLFEESEDMHFFINEVREKLQLIVHTALIPNRRSDSFKPPCNISDIKKFGFSSYLREIIEAPEAILTYMCMYSHVYTIPIGNDKTHDKLQEIMPHVQKMGFQRIYTHSHCYTFSKSRYTNKISSSSNEVQSGYWLTSSIDNNMIMELEKRKKNIEIDLKKLNNEHSILGDQKKEHELQIEGSRAQLGKLRERKQYIENLNKKYKFNEKKLESLQNEKNELFTDAEVLAKLIGQMAKQRAKLINEYVKASEKMLIVNKDKILSTYQDTQFQLEKRKLENDIREYKVSRVEFSSQLGAIDIKIKEGKENANSALEDASDLNGISLKESGVPENHKKKFAELSDSIEEIEQEIHRCEAISSCSFVVEERDVAEFYERQKVIEKLQKEYEKKKDKLENQKKNYDALKNSWIDEVEKMIKDINEKFTILFRQLKCAGEINLNIPDDSSDFSKYGVRIMVSFRNNEQMQELTAWQQSGGEKSVATMMYMIALQEMTKCPFRVVDEINQGMDPTNERKVFDIIVSNSCRKLFAQYFLLTPKLLPDLNFDERTNVICVYNGPKNLPHTKYNLEHFIELRREMTTAERE